MQILERRFISREFKTLAQEAKINLALMAADTACTDVPDQVNVRRGREDVPDPGQIASSPVGV